MRHYMAPWTKEQKREYQRRWRAAHPGKSKEYQKAWKSKNPEKVAKSRKDWSAANKERQREYWRRWREAKKILDTPEMKAASRAKNIIHVSRWQKNNPERVEGYRIKALYGVTSQARDEQLAAQGGACAICKAPDRRFSIDHDHETGAFRGILCINCNAGLGQFGDNPVALEAALVYLRDPPVRQKSSLPPVATP